jgi:multiple sugar transport system permease protein
VPDGVRRRPAGLTGRHREWLAAAGFLAPAVVAVLVLRLWPTLQAVMVAFEVGPGSLPSLANFRFLFADPEFTGSLATTALYSVLVNPIQIALALGLAVLLNQALPAVGLWRTLVLLPVAVPQAVSAVIWGVAMRPDGPLNAAFQALGLGAQPFLTSPRQALASIIVIVSWIGVGYWMTFLIAGLKDIPTQYYEAAAIDGAGAWQRFRLITLPLLRRPLTFVLVADTVANFLVFAPVEILTRGGPQGSTNLVMNEIYNRAFDQGDTAGAAAATTILVLVVVAVVSIQFRLMLAKDDFS